MLSAYYNCSEDTSSLFDRLKISASDTYHEHLNRYDVIKVNMQEFLSATHSVFEMLEMLKKYISYDLFDRYEDVRYRDEKNFIQVIEGCFL